LVESLLCWELWFKNLTLVLGSSLALFQVHTPQDPQAHPQDAGEVPGLNSLNKKKQRRSPPLVESLLCWELWFKNLTLSAGLLAGLFQVHTPQDPQAHPQDAGEVPGLNSLNKKKQRRSPSLVASLLCCELWFENLTLSAGFPAGALPGARPSRSTGSPPRRWRGPLGTE
jgi:hypothetical protein